MTEYYKNEDLFVKSDETGNYVKQHGKERKLTTEDRPLLGYVCLEGEPATKEEYDNSK